MIPTCFSNPNTLSSTSQESQNLITCIYQTLVFNSPIYLTLTWSKTHFSHSLTIHASDSFSFTISLYPSTFSIFKTRFGSKSMSLTHHHHCQRIKLYWDFTRAEFNHNSAEPESRFYIAISCNGILEFFIGDLVNELLTQKSGLVMTREVGEQSLLLSRREHVFGRKNYVSRAEFLGSKHDIEIECSGGVLRVKVDGELRLAVKRLAWKFRGNERILVGGIEVNFYWDVFNWVNNSNGRNNGHGHGVFVFQVGEGVVCPEIAGPEKRLMRKSLSSSGGSGSIPSISLPPSPSCSNVLQWAEERSDGRRSSCSSTRSYGSNVGFSLLLYAWRKD